MKIVKAHVIEYGLMEDKGPIYRVIDCEGNLIGMCFSELEAKTVVLDAVNALRFDANKDIFLDYLAMEKAKGKIKIEVSNVYEFGIPAQYS